MRQSLVSPDLSKSQGHRRAPCTLPLVYLGLELSLPLGESPTSPHINTPYLKASFSPLPSQEQAITLTPWPTGVESLLPCSCTLDRAGLEGLLPRNLLSVGPGGGGIWAVLEIECISNPVELHCLGDMTSTVNVTAVTHQTASHL